MSGPINREVLAYCAADHERLLRIAGKAHQLFEPGGGVPNDVSVAAGAALSHVSTTPTTMCP